MVSKQLQEIHWKLEDIQEQINSWDFDSEHRLQELCRKREVLRLSKMDQESKEKIENMVSLVDKNKNTSVKKDGRVNRYPKPPISL